MKIDIPAAAWLCPPARREPDIVLGVITRNVYVPNLDGDFQQMAVLKRSGVVYQLLGEHPDGALYLQVGKGLTIDDHAKFVPGALDSALPSQRCYSLLRRTVWDHRDRFDDKWSARWDEELKPFAGMRLPDRPTDEYQVDLQLPWLHDLVLINGLLHRRVEQPLIMVGDFRGGWKLAWGWDDRPDGAMLCYSLSEIEHAREAARKICRELGTRYDPSLKNVVRSSQLVADAAGYRYALYCEQFCRTLKHTARWSLTSTMHLIQRLIEADRELLQRVASVGELTGANRADFDFVRVGSELLELDESTPLAQIKLQPYVRELTEILKAEGPPNFSVEFPLHF